MNDASARAFARAAAPLRSLPGVSEGTGFGSSTGLRVRGKIFAFVSRDADLVVKLPKSVVDALVDRGEARRFDPGHGRPMKEWAAIGVEHRRSWSRRIAEAKAYVERAPRPRTTTR